MELAIPLAHPIATRTPQLVVSTRIRASVLPFLKTCEHLSDRLVCHTDDYSFGVGPGAGAGPACGTCWKLTGQTDSSGNALSNAGTSIVVMVNNLCPASGNPLCSQSGLTGTNQYGANVNFDLCSDSGAQAAFFGNNGVGLAIGTASQVDCSQWSGTIVH